MSQLIDVESIEYQTYLRNAIGDALQEHLVELSELLEAMITKIDKDYKYFRNELALDIASNVRLQKK
ncbi:MAG: hypothetical protein CMM04_16765 [Rhodopirellula sp.]|nr:hypothetical protein [Rhodopirellula sp.]|tara:strand:+ start:6368 stop:6568 length:201 start_codon:yes stop_codon:yes gene_type:complete